MGALLPCPSCARHVRSTEPACPFCGAAVAFSHRKRPPKLRRLTRAAAWAFGASLSVAGCNREVLPGPSDSAPPPDLAWSLPPDMPPDMAEPPQDFAFYFDLALPDGEYWDLSGGTPIYGGPPPPDPK
jgi:hypothetical protein